MHVLRIALRATWPLPALLVLVFAVAEIGWAAGDSVTRGIVVVALINLTLVVGLYVFVGNSGVFSFGSVGFASIGAGPANLTETAAVTGRKPPPLPDRPSGFGPARSNADGPVPSVARPNASSAATASSRSPGDKRVACFCRPRRSRSWVHVPARQSTAS